MIIDEPERVRLLLRILSDCMQKYKCIFAKMQYTFSRRYLGFIISAGTCIQSPLGEPKSRHSGDFVSSNASSSRFFGLAYSFQVAADRFELMPEMLQKKLPRPNSVTPLQSLNDQLVFPHRGSPTIVIHLVSHIARSQQPRVEVLVGRGKNGIPGRRHDMGMNFLI
jgi:hypothetical protein